MMNDYRIIAAMNHFDIAAQANMLLDIGYVTVGGVQVCFADGETYFFQAMLLSEDVDKVKPSQTITQEG